MRAAVDGSEIRLGRRSAYLQLPKIQYLFSRLSIYFVGKTAHRGSFPVQVPECRELNLYVSNKKTRSVWIFEGMDEMGTAHTHKRLQDCTCLQIWFSAEKSR